MTATLAHGAPINLPVLLETRLLVQANSGGGKSWALRRVLEQTAPLVQQLVIDPEGEFATLREKFDYVIAAPHDGDALATPQTAALLARRLLESGVSAILDIYDLKAHDRILFVRRFLEALVNAPKSLWRPVLIALDEAHVYAPQVGSAESLQAVSDIATRGRKRGQCLLAATQRLSKLHKDVAAELGNKMIGRTGLDVDVKRAADELGLTSREATESLRNLAPGEFYVFGPALSRTVDRVRVGEVLTSHPKAGNRMMQAPPAPSPKLRAQLSKLADLQKDAEQEARTVDELRAEVAKLKRDLAATQRSAGGVPESVLAKRIEAAVSAAEKERDRVSRELQAHISRAQKQAHELQSTLARIIDPSGSQVAEPTARDPGPVRVAPSRPEHWSARPAAAVASAAGITGPEQRILNAIAWMNAIGVDEPEQAPVAFLAGYTIGGGAWNNPRGSLCTKGLIEYRGDALVLTDAGATIAQPPEIGRGEGELHDAIMQRLPGPERKLLTVLINVHPRAMTNAELAERAGYAPNGGAYNNPRGRLRSLGLIEYRDGMIRARDILFPEQHS